MVYIRSSLYSGFIMVEHILDWVASLYGGFVNVECIFDRKVASLYSGFVQIECILDRCIFIQLLWVVCDVMSFCWWHEWKSALKFYIG